MKAALELIRRGVDEILTEEDLIVKLKSKKQLLIKVRLAHIQRNF